MNRARGYRDGLPRTEPQFCPALQIDDERPLDDEKQFVGCRVVMPAKDVVEHGETEATAVDPADHLVSIGFQDRGRLSFEVHHLQRRKPNRFARVGVGRDSGGTVCRLGHSVPPSE